MTIRCASCHGTVWIQPAERGAKSVTATCRSCEQRYCLKEWRILGRNDSPMAARARRLAKNENLDLPSAYSVLLGVATAEELRDVGGAGSTPSDTVPTGGADAPPYDPAFQPAIDAGRLSVRQATERGERDAWVARLASRHRLPRPVACDVADNRISLLEAVRLRKPAAATVHPAPRRGMLVPLGLLAILVVVIGIAATTRDGGVRVIDGHGAKGAFGAAEIRTNSDGRIVQVFGPDPKSVLRAYCAAGQRPLEPLEIVPFAPSSGERSRLGLLRDPRRPAELQAITIREDRASGLWQAGEAGQVLSPGPAPDGAERALRRR